MSGQCMDNSWEEKVELSLSSELIRSAVSNWQCCQKRLSYITKSPLLSRIALVRCGPGRRNNAMNPRPVETSRRKDAPSCNQHRQALPYPCFRGSNISFQQGLACLVEILIKPSKLQHPKAGPSSTKRLPWTVWAVHSVHKSTWVWQHVVPWFEWCDGVCLSSLSMVGDRILL